MAAGFKPSVARLYDAEDGAQHGFDSFAPEQSVLIFTTEGPAGVSQATADGIAEIVDARPEVTRVDTEIIRDWFAHLNWGPEKLIEEQEFIRESTCGWGTPPRSRATGRSTRSMRTASVGCEFSIVADITMLGGHSSHSYQTGTNMYFVYDYNVVDCTIEEEQEKYTSRSMRSSSKRRSRQAGSMSPTRHRQVPRPVDRRGARHGLPAGARAQERVRLNGIMNLGTIYPAEGG